VKEAIVKVEAATSLINEIRQAVFTAKAAGPDRDAKFYAAAEGLIAAYNLTKDARAYLALAGQKRDCPGRC
jgi:hypothetical protein